jgi:hypothetical protein
MFIPWMEEPMRKTIIVFQWGVVPALLVSTCVSNSAFGQSKLSLEPMRPAATVSAETATAPSLPPTPTQFAPLPPPGNRVVPASAGIVSNTPIQLQELPRPTAPSIPAIAVANAAPKPQTPINVQPLTPVAKAPESKSNEKLFVEKMIGPPADSLDLFRRMEPKAEKTRSSFFENAEMSYPVRRQNGEMGEMEWTPDGFCWTSPAFCYSPLYFEQPNYERYGQGKGKPWASTVSAARFFGQAVTLPIAMVATPPWTKQCTLGHHRPGDCAPYQRKPDHRQ